MKLLVIGLNFAAPQLVFDLQREELARQGKQGILLDVPQTYPLKSINGYVVADFLTPSSKSQCTHPTDLKVVVARVSGGYALDVGDFCTPISRPYYVGSMPRWKSVFGW